MPARKKTTTTKKAATKAEKTNVSTPKKRTVVKSKPQVKPIVVIVVASVLVVASYIGGYHHHRIMAMIGPLFGYNAHAGELDLSSVQETYRTLKANFDGEIDDNDLIIGANRGLVEAAGDEYTVYMNEKESEDFDNSLSGSIGGGIGAELFMNDDGQVSILRVLKNVPAEKSGLMSGDVITKVNSDSAVDWTVEEAVAAIRGEIGSTVKLTIDRADSKGLEFSITRALITVPSVESSLEGSVGVLTITRFDSDTAHLARSEAKDLLDGGAKSIILDLRGNSGGYLNAAVDVAGIWINNKEVVSERRGDSVIKSQKTKNNAILEGVPTVVLVNGSSASASEIVAGAMQDYKVAKLVGQTTFGKGSVQSLFNLGNNGQLKVTIAKWYTPFGKNIAKDGISPDYVVEPVQGVDVQKRKASELLRG